MTLIPFLILAVATSYAEEDKTVYDVQNAFRVLHGLPILQWDDALASHALDWAEHVVAEKRVEEISDDAMNLAWSSGPAWPARKAVCYWYVEGYSGGHYRQMMSDVATKTGIGIARSEDFGTVVIAVYDQGYHIADHGPPIICPHLLVPSASP